MCIKLISYKMFDRTTSDSVSACYDMEELQDLINQRYNSIKVGSTERRPICAQMSLDSVMTARARNYSVGGCPSNNLFTPSSNSATMVPITNVPIPGSFHTGTSTLSSSSSSPTASSTPSLISINDSAFTVPVREHRKLDRSASEPGDRLSLLTNNGGLIGRGLNSTRYKTELCRPFEESGYCRYGDKCQFAHGEHELRNLSRHPKYKTEPCRTYHTVGFCPYGARCHFIHNEEERAICLQQQQHQLQMQQQQQQQRHMSGESQVSMATSNMNMSHPGPVRRPQSINFSSSLSSLGSTADSPPSSVTDSPSLSPTFFGEEFPFVQSCYGSGLSASTLPSQATPSSHSLGTYNQSSVMNVTNINTVFNMATSNTNFLAVNKPVPGVIDSSSVNIGTFSSEALSSLMSPLNVQTQLGNLNSSVFLNNLLNQYNTQQQQTGFQDSPIIDTDSQSSNFPDLSDLQLLVDAPPSPPDSVSGDSLASSMSSSTGSLENGHAPCGSPTDRLSVFRKLQVESC